MGVFQLHFKEGYFKAFKVTEATHSVSFLIWLKGTESTEGENGVPVTTHDEQKMQKLVTFGCFASTGLAKRASNRIL